MSIKKNTLQEDNDNLANVDYVPLLKEILAILKQQQALFQAEAGCLKIDLDTVASAVVTRLQKSNFNEIIPFTYTMGTQFASVKFTDGGAIKAFRLQLEHIQEYLQAALDVALKQYVPGISTENYVTSLLSDPDLFTGNVAKLHYPFNDITSLTKRHLHLRPRTSGGSKADDRLRGHTVTITVKNLNTFDAELIEGLCNKLADTCECSEQEIEKVRAVLKRRAGDETREISKLRHIVQIESLGRLQKEARIRYLEYLSKIIDSASEKKLLKEQENSASGPALLRILAKRLRYLEAFINDPDKADGEYQVSYGGYGVNYRDMFSRADSYNLLPIISEIEGSLGETFNKETGEQVFTAGIKLKLNGSVQTYKSVFEYYLTLLDPSSEEHKKRKKDPRYNNQSFVEKVLKIAFLYYFVFKKMEDENYNPASNIENELLTCLRRTDDSAEGEKTKKLIWLKNGLNNAKYHTALGTLESTLKELIKNKSSKFEVETTPLHLSVSDRIVDPNCDRMLIEKEFFLAEVLQEKERKALKYISIQEPTAEGDALCVLPVTITFEPITYYTTPDETSRQFKMRYNLNHFKMLPVILVPSEEKSLALCEEYYKSYKRIVLKYQTGFSFKPDSREAFVYRFTYLLLSYMSLKLLTDAITASLNKENNRLFIPLLRIHSTPMKADGEADDLSSEDRYLRSLSKVLAHMLGADHYANAQGFYIGVLDGGKNLENKLKSPRDAEFRLANGLSSLYSVLPKIFELDTTSVLENMAIIVVSSRKCDAHFNSPLSLYNVYGEVIGIRRRANGRIQVVTLNTFAANEESHRMYVAPTVIQEQAKKCYDRGYRNILYVAMAPYSSTLHLSTTEKREEQFFMSQTVIEALKHGKADLNIYPIYCDKFYVVKIGTDMKIESLYVDDTRELRTLVDDPNRSSVVFFNLLNGLTVNRESVYNGVVSYATLVNVYDDPIYDQTIRNNLLDGSQPGSLKSDILDFLTLFHFSRYERKGNISFKLDPYDNIIGSDSVGSLSVLPHMMNTVRFSALAFLTEVRSLLNRHYTGYAASLFQDEDSEKPSEA